MNKNVTVTFNLLLSLLLACFIVSCSDSSSTKPDPEPPTNPPEKKPTRFKDIGPAPADGVLETVTWNLEWYGHDFGPKNEKQQTKNFLTILDNLNADLYAFQEVSSGDMPNDNNFSSKESLLRLVANMKGYKGFVAKGISQSQRTAFVYNTKAIDSVSAGLIKKNQDFHDWGSGRFPFYFKFKYHSEEQTSTIYAIVIHAKAGDEKEDYNRRKDAAQQLYHYLIANKKDANIILLGDYNDDVDVSIYNGTKSPYEPFIKDNNSFKVVTKEISKNGQTTYIGYPDAIDHIIISNELFDEYMPKSAKAVIKVTEWLGIPVDKYEQTTTGHYPVMATFDFK